MRLALVLLVFLGALPLAVGLPPQPLVCAGLEDEQRCTLVAANLEGDSDAFVAASAKGDARGMYAVSGTGDAAGLVAVSGAGTATACDHALTCLAASPAAPSRTAPLPRAERDLPPASSPSAQRTMLRGASPPPPPSATRPGRLPSASSDAATA